VTETEYVVTALLLSIARASELLRKTAFALREEPGWSEVTYSMSVGEFNLHLPDPNERLALQGSLQAHLSDGRDVQWELEIARSGDSGWLVERSLYVYPPASDVPSRRDLPDNRPSGSADLAANLPQLVEEWLSVRPEVPPGKAVTRADRES
jgi:hypothetical protein